MSKTDTSQSGFWDSIDDLLPPSDWFKFESIGDRISGTIAKLARKSWDDGSVAIEVHWKDPGTVALSANQVLLKRALVQLKPAEVTSCTVVFSGTEKAGRGQMKHFDVTLRRGGKGDIEAVDTRTLTNGSGPKF